MARNIWDGFGRRIGSVSDLPDGKKHVYDVNGQPRGSVGRDGTLTVNSKLVSRTPMSGLLLNRSNKQKR